MSATQNLNPGDKKWKLYAHNIIAREGIDDLIFEVSANKQIIFKKGTESYTLADLSNNTSDTAAIATKVTVTANNSTDETVYLTFVDDATGTQGIETDTGLSYNPSTGLLTTTSVAANLTGNITGNVSGTAATVTGAAQTNITSLGTLTALQVDYLNVDGNTITASSGALNLTPAAGSAIVLDGTINIDAGIVTGVESITSTGGTFTNLTFGATSTQNLLPTNRGSSGQFLKTDGAGSLSWATAVSGGVTVNDSTANTNFPVVFHNENNGDLLDDTGTFTYNPSTGNLTVSGTITADTSITLDSTTITTAEFGVLASVTPGTAAGSKALVLDGNKDIGTIRNLTIDGVFTDGNYTFDTDGNVSGLGTVGCGAITSSGNLAVTGTITADTSITLDSITVTTAELGVLDGVTQGTATASKALVLDGNKDIGTIRNLTIDGVFTDGNYTFNTDGNVSGLGTVGCGAITSSGSGNFYHILETTGNHAFSKFKTSSGEFGLGTTGNDFGIYSYDDSEYRMMITDTGLVGFGTTTAQEKLHIYGSGTTRIEVESDGTHAYLKATSSSRAYGVGTSAASFKIWDYTAGAARVCITSGGDMGIGTDTPGAKLDVVGDITASGSITGGSFVIGSANISEAELETIDGITAGTAAASKALVLDSNKDIGTIRNLTIDGVFTDGNYTFDTDGNVSGLGTVGCGAITSSGNLAITGTITADASITLDSTTITTAELGVLDGVTAGTAAASKALVLDGNKDIGTIRNLTATKIGAFEAAGAINFANQAMTNVDINSGSIDGTIIGANTAAAGTFTQINLYNANGNSTITKETNKITIDPYPAGGDISGTVVIKGDLIVDGTTTTINSTTVDISDTILTLNSNLDGSPSLNAGLEVNRGSSDNKTFLWDETNDRWTIGSENLEAGTLIGNVQGNVEGNVTGNLTGNADTATTLQNARNIGGVSFNGASNIDLPGVNTAGNQNTSGTAAKATKVTVTDNNTTNETVYLTFVEDATGSLSIETDTGLNYNPFTGLLTTISVAANLTGNVTGNVSGTAATVTGAAQTNITSLGTLTQLDVDNLTLDEYTISSAGDINLTPAADSVICLDGTIDIDAGVVTGATSITSTEFVGNLTGDVTGNVSGTAATVTVNDSTANTNFPLVFHNESNGLLDDTGTFTYNPSTGAINAGKDTDTTSYFGRAAIGFAAIGVEGHYNYAAFSHVDMHTKTNYALLQHENGMTFLNAASGQPIHFRINNGDKMRLTSGGSLGIGTINPSEKLEVTGNIKTSGSITGGSYLSLAGSITGLYSITLDTTTITTAELGVLDGVTQGTAAASKALVVDSNKDITGLRDVTITGSLTVGDAGKIGNSGTSLILAHKDKFSSGSCALIQDSDGNTTINCASYKEIRFTRAGAVTPMKIEPLNSSNLVTVSGTITADGYNFSYSVISGNGNSDVNGFISIKNKLSIRSSASGLGTVTNGGNHGYYPDIYGTESKETDSNTNIQTSVGIIDTDVFQLRKGSVAMGGANSIDGGNTRNAQTGGYARWGIQLKQGGLYRVKYVVAFENETYNNRLTIKSTLCLTVKQSSSPQTEYEIRLLGGEGHEYTRDGRYGQYGTITGECVFSIPNAVAEISSGAWLRINLRGGKAHDENQLSDVNGLKVRTMSIEMDRLGDAI